MDNLGIIKLLTQALTTLNGKNKNESTTSGFNFGGILDALKNFNLNKNAPQSSEAKVADLSQNQTSSNRKKETTSTTQRAYLPPLQSGMINVMDSHDKFVKRVMSRTNDCQKNT